MPTGTEEIIRAEHDSSDDDAGRGSEAISEPFAGNTATLPADVAHRRTLGENTIADADALERCGLQHEADELRRRANYAEAERMSQRIDESRQVQQQAAQKAQEWASMGVLQRMGHEPMTPEKVAY